MHLLADYRLGEIPPINEQQVTRWLAQFPLASRSVILHAMARMLPKVYLSHTHAQRFCEKLLVNKQVWGANPVTALARSRFLQLQAPGHSQQVMLQLFNEMLREKAGFTVHDCWESAQQYVYLDDTCLSGRTLIQTLQPWLRSSARPGSKVLVCLVAAEMAGLTNARNALQPLANAKHITITYHIAYTIGEKLNGNNSLLTPEEEYIITSAFFNAGQQIISGTQNAQSWLHPLGFNASAAGWTRKLFFNWRNIPNNCPPALWWGRPDWQGTVLANWTPLIPRNIERKEQTYVPIAA